MHELTEKLKNEFIGLPHSKEIADSIIRQYLQEKAKELSKGDEASFEWYETRLGLSPSSSEHSEAICTENGRTSCVHKPKDSEVWCAHTKFICKNSYEPRSVDGYVLVEHDGTLAIDDNWMFCPICGTPRPTPKSLAERFFDSGMSNGWFTNFPDNAKKFCDELVKISESHFTNHNKER